MSEMINVSGVRGYIDEHGTAQLHLEDVARGLGLTERKGDGAEYVRWARVKGYLDEFRFATSGEFIPENIFYRLAMKANNETAIAFQALVADEILPEIRKTGTYSRDMSVEDLIIMQARSMKDLRSKVEQVQGQLAVVGHRIDSLDATDIIGDLRQRLNKMVQRYAYQRGIPYNHAWKDFTQAYNTAWHTNLELLRTNLQAKMSKQVTVPEYLELSGRLEDAVRVMDKLLNAGAQWA